MHKTLKTLNMVMKLFRSLKYIDTAMPSSSKPWSFCSKELSSRPVGMQSGIRWFFPSITILGCLRLITALSLR